MSYAQATIASARPPQKTVLVTGANGYIGFAVSCAFMRAGWRVYGLTRRADTADTLRAEEIIPVIGAISADLAFLDELLSQSTTRPFDVVVSCTEQIPFDQHWAHLESLFIKVAHHARQHGAAKPLVLVSSGCKDYGVTLRHGETGLAPHTEESPLQPSDFLQSRTYCTLEAFEHADLFDAAVVRPTPLFGHGGSYYGVILEAMAGISGADGSRKGAPGYLPCHPDNIYHGCHIDDCAEAYVALATHPVRAEVNGECFNISGYRYETVSDIVAALSAEYKISGGISLTMQMSEIESPELRALDLVFNYSQWVDSTKIRKLTGWTDKRPLFSESLPIYRLAYEAAVRASDAGVARIRDRLAGWATSGVKIAKSDT